MHLPQLLTALSVAILITFAGCSPPHSRSTPQAQDSPVQGPVKAVLLPLTDFYKNDSASGIKAYVTLIDSENQEKQFPAVFRFELYEKVFHSGEPMGRRIKIWPDFELQSIDTNDIFWQKFLNAYEFDLQLDNGETEHFILQVTCIFDNQRRLTDTIELQK